MNLLFHALQAHIHAVMYDRQSLTYLHIFYGLVQDFFRIFHILQNIVDICLGDSGETIEHVHVEGTAADRSGSWESRRSEGPGLGQEGEEYWCCAYLHVDIYIVMSDGDLNYCSNGMFGGTRRKQ
jgi:hypothetical protein